MVIISRPPSGYVINWIDLGGTPFSKYVKLCQVEYVSIRKILNLNLRTSSRRVPKVSIEKKERFECN